MQSYFKVFIHDLRVSVPKSSTACGLQIWLEQHECQGCYPFMYWTKLSWIYAWIKAVVYLSLELLGNSITIIDCGCHKYVYHGGMTTLMVWFPFAFCNSMSPIGAGIGE